MVFEGVVIGIGERAEAFTLETDPGFAQSEYKIHARDDNLVLEVWLAVGGYTFPPKIHTGGVVRHVSDSTYRAIYFVWRANVDTGPSAVPALTVTAHYCGAAQDRPDQLRPQAKET